MQLRHDDDLAAFVRRRRKELGLTQDQLAQRAGVRRATVVDLEKARSRPAFSTATALLHALDVSLTATSRLADPTSTGPAQLSRRVALDRVLARVRA